METKAAVVFETSGDYQMEQLHISDPNDNEVLVRIVSVGICHTDLAARDGHLPIPPPPSVFGHEGAGIVEKDLSFASLPFPNLLWPTNGIPLRFGKIFLLKFWDHWVVGL
jgi:hypothetical protein